MSMLTEKRQEIAAKLERLEKARFENIQMKLAAYRAQLEAEPESEEIKHTRKVLEAMDAVILYDIENAPKVEPAPIAEPAKAEPAPVVEPAPVEEAKAEPVIEEKAAVEEVAEPIVEPIAEAIPEAKAEEAVNIVAEMPIKEETVNVEIRVNEAGQPEIKSEELEARPGMAYVGIPERR